MNKIKFFALAVFSLLFQIDAIAQTLNYGDEIHLQNGWNNYSGGYLDTRGYQKDFEKTGNHLCVSTATTNARAKGSGTWKVLSAKGKAIGTPVLIGDEIHLQNAWENYNGGFLDTRGFQKDFAKTGNHLCVSTATVNKRDGGSGTWKILSATGKANGTAVTQNLEVHLQNGWNNYSGGFLDTRGFQKDFAKTGNHLCVSTATANKRDGGSGTWKVQIIGASKNTPVEKTKASVELPSKFKVLAYSVGEGKGDKDAYWFALNNNDSRGRILSQAKLGSNAKWMEIQRIDLGNNIYAFKVTNAGDDMYLTARDNKEVHVEKAPGGNIPEGAKFKSVSPLTSAPGANDLNFRSFQSVKFANHYLRHAGFAMFVHTSNGTELFKQDASWLIEKM